MLLVVMLLANELRRIIGRHGRLHKSLWDGGIGVLCKILQINKVNKFSKLLTFINGGGNAAHEILRIFVSEKEDYDLK